MRRSSLRCPLLMLSDRFDDLATERVEPKRISISEILIWILAAMCFELKVWRPGLNVMLDLNSDGLVLGSPAS
jgi:hypothetical protein